MRKIIAILLLLAPALFAQTSTRICCRRPGVERRTGRPAAANPATKPAATTTSAERADRRKPPRPTRPTRWTAAQAQTSQQQQTVAELKGDVANLKTGADASAQETQQAVNSELEGPLTIRFKGVSITPGGFVAAEFVRRSRALGADVTTPFNSLPLPGASQSKESEFFGSARQSRPTVYLLCPLEARRTLQLYIGRLSLGRRHLHGHPDQQLHVPPAPSLGTG